MLRSHVMTRQNVTLRQNLCVHSLVTYVDVLSIYEPDGTQNVSPVRAKLMEIWAHRETRASNTK